MNDRPPVRLDPPGARPCKVCGGDASPFGAVDFNRSCEDAKGAVLPPMGVPVGYRRCTVCGLIFTEAFDDWSPAEFQTYIYNDRYGDVDPDFAGARPRRMAAQVAAMFRGAAGEIRHLDYGGGSGLLAQTLRAEGFDAGTYDPFSADHAARPTGRFNLITCFETIEHMNDPQAGAADIASFLDDDGVILFSTLLQPPDIAAQGTGWWYIGPRNGHVTLHSVDSLGRLWDALGLDLIVFSAGSHAAFRKLPAFARRAFPGSVNDRA